jgi:hypothetical protein
MNGLEFILAGMLAAATPFLLAALGELVVERSGGGGGLAFGWQSAEVHHWPRNSTTAKILVGGPTNMGC